MSTIFPPIPFHHWCEVCGRREMLSADEAYKTGWDFPPHIGVWGAVSFRTCPTCPTEDTLYWALVIDQSLSREDPMSWPARHRRTLARILQEEDTPLPWEMQP